MLQNTIFMVNEEPYCIWEVDLRQRNREFLDGIDATYFDYALKTHLQADDEKRASIALRLSLHHALETLFSLIGAYVQATDCAYAWVAKCSTPDLRQFVTSVNAKRNDIFKKINIPSVTWEYIAESVFSGYLPGTERHQNTVRLFGVLWERLAHELLDQDHVDEYNSLKHGFRIRSGGFGLACGVEHEYGVPPPDDEMKLLGHSGYGTSFLRIEAVGGKKSRSLRSRKQAINWKIEKVALLLQLAYLSINNVISALKIANGAQAGTCLFTRPEEDAEFDRPWGYSPGVTSCSFDFVVDDNQIIVLSKDELLARVKESR